MARVDYFIATCTQSQSLDQLKDILFSMLDAHSILDTPIRWGIVVLTTVCCNASAQCTACVDAFERNVRKDTLNVCQRKLHLLSGTLLNFRSCSQLIMQALGHCGRKLIHSFHRLVDSECSTYRDKLETQAFIISISSSSSSARLPRLV